MYKQKPTEEQLDEIFGDGRKGPLTLTQENTKKEQEQTTAKVESTIKVSSKYKVAKPLI